MAHYLLLALLSGSGRYFYPATGTAFHLRIIAGRVFTIIPVIRRSRFRGRHRARRLLLDVNRGIGGHDHNGRINNGRINGRIIVTAGRISVVVRPIIRLTIIRPPITIASINSDIAARVAVIAISPETPSQTHIQIKVALTRIVIVPVVIVATRIIAMTMAPGSITHRYSGQNQG